MKNILIVGGGSIGERHLRCFLATGQVRASLCETRRARTRELEERYPVEASFDDFRKAPLSEFAAVVIGVPAHLHVRMATACARAGVPFLVEKPLSVTLRGVQQLKELVRRRRLVAGVAYLRRSIPCYQKLRELALGGLIGKLRMARFNFGQEFPRYRPDYQRIYYASEQTGGGCITDAASHVINLAEWLFGRPKEVVCLYDRLELKRVECEDCCMLLLRFRKNRALAEVFINQFQKPNVGEIEIIGTEGNLRLDASGAVHTISHCADDENRWRVLEKFRYERDDYFVFQAKEFLATLDGKASPPTSIAEAESTLRVCIAAKKSQKQGRILSLARAK